MSPGILPEAAALSVRIKKRNRRLLLADSAFRLVLDLSRRGRACCGLLQKGSDGGAGIAGLKTGVAGIQPGDLLQLRFREGEIKNIQIFLHALGICGFDQRHDPPLGQPAQDHLRRGFTMGRPDLAKDFIVEQIVLSGRQRRPGLQLDPLLLCLCVIKK